MSVVSFIVDAAAAGFKKIASLADLPQSGAVDGQVPVWSDADKVWRVGTLPAFPVEDLAHMLQSGATPAQVPMWTGSQWQASSRLEDLSTTRANKDANSIYTTVSHLRKDGTLFRQSVLSGGTSPTYTTRTVKYYGTDGTTVLATEVFALAYSGTDVISETLQ